MELNRDQIIKAMECCYSNNACDGCPYTELVGCRRELERDAFALLKAQAEDYTALDEQYRMLYEENERLRERNIVLEQKFIILERDEQYVVKVQVKGE